MTARRVSLRVLALAAVLSAAAVARPAAAQSKSDTFAGKIPPIAGQLYRKAGRLEITPEGDLSLNDAFFTKRFAGLKLDYHFSEAFSLGVHAATGTTGTTGSAVICPKNSGCVEATKEKLWQVPGRIKTLAGVNVGWSPIYGKMNVFAEKVAHFDLSVLAGADMISYDEVVGSSQASELLASGGTPGTKSSIGGHVGLGARIFFAEWVALRLEVKDYIYGVAVPNQGPGQDIQNQIFTELGLSFFLPFHNRPLP